MALDLYRKKLDLQSNKKNKTMATEEKEEVKETKDEPCDCAAAEFISYIFACRSIVHMLHLNRTGIGADAAHRALGDYYDKVVPIIDSIAETTQGYKGAVLKGYKDFPVAEYENYDPAVYLKEVRAYVQEHRFTSFPKDYSPIQNELDNLENLLNITIYKLEQLK